MPHAMPGCGCRDLCASVQHSGDLHPAPLREPQPHQRLQVRLDQLASSAVRRLARLGLADIAAAASPPPPAASAASLLPPQGCCGPQ